MMFHTANSWGSVCVGACAVVLSLTRIAAFQGQACMAAEPKSADVKPMEVMSADRAQVDRAIDRAVAYLSREVPRWARENKCYSCHNNGDGARALILAARSGKLPDKTVLEDTLAFLRQPATWDANGPEGPFKDKHLARLQFAAATAEAVDEKLIKDPRPLRDAAALVASWQNEDGSWSVDANAALGSPVTYGTPLATVLACGVLARAKMPVKYGEAHMRGRSWLESAPVPNVLTAAATLWGLEGFFSSGVDRQVERCLRMIREGESETGGWGPFVQSPPEVFDTALVLLALRTVRGEEAIKQKQIERGLHYLVTRQSEDGSWPATTRPPGGDSYAQQISTTAWATIALLETHYLLPEADKAADAKGCADKKFPAAKPD